MTEAIRIGIIGPGRVARHRHLPALSGISGVKLSLVWGPDADKTRQVASEFGIPETARDWRDVAESPDVDAVVIATPPILHSAATVAALHAGKHVLCQSRMARNLREALAMHRAAQGAGRVTCLYPPQSGLKGDRVMRRLLHEERFIGDVLEVRVAGLSPPDASDEYDWRTDPNVVGVQAMTLGLWAEVLHRWVGPPVRVAATGGAHGRRRTRDGRWVDAVVPDSLALSAEMACGATASYHFSGRAGASSHHAIEIYGDRGMLIYRLREETVWGAAAGESSLRSIDIPSDSVRSQTTDAEFIQAIREGGHVSPSFEEGLQYMGFCEAVAWSLATGNISPVPPPVPVMESWGRFLEGADDSVPPGSSQLVSPQEAETQIR